MRLASFRLLAPVIALGGIAVGYSFVARLEGGNRAARAKLDTAVARGLASGETVAQRVIIRTVPGATDGLEARLRASGQRVKVKHELIPAVSAAVSNQQLLSLARDASVESISADARVSGMQVPDTLAHGEPLSRLLATLGLDNSPGGDKVGVAVIDSGLEPSADFATGTTVAFYDFLFAPTRATSHDVYGHGTHVAGLITSLGVFSTLPVERYKPDGRIEKVTDSLYRGVATKARLVSYKVLDSDGVGYTSSVIAAIEHAVANRTALGIDIINLSLGHPILEPAATDPLVLAVEAACRAGIVVVVSAGNHGRSLVTNEPGYGGITSPGNAPSAITVGALDTLNTVGRSDDTVAPYSSRGPTWYDALAKPDVVAPGHRLASDSALQSTLYALYPSRRVTVNPRYPERLFSLSGTSMAAAVTTGVVARIIEANMRAQRASKELGPPVPLSPNTIKAILQYTAIPLPDVDELTQGAGSLNAAGALELARAIDPRQPVGKPWLSLPLTPMTNVGGTELAWSQRIVWGDTTIGGDGLFSIRLPAWGQEVVWGNRIVWGDAARPVVADAQNIVWGNNIVWSNNVVWGNNIVWGNNVVWGNSIVWGNNVVWGNGSLGSLAGNTAIWGDNVVWGNVGPQNIVWGNLSGVFSKALGSVER